MKFTMINNEEFVIRLRKVIDFYDETASSFAENIGVQRSSISHILSGRNKPSLDFVLKVLSAYPDVELYWLLNGKGTFPLASKTDQESLTTETPKSNQAGSSQINSNSETTDKGAINSPPTTFDKKSIERIIIFYSDGTFKNFKPS